MKTRSPERDKAFKLYIKSGKTMKNSEIASKLGVSASLVAKWKSQDKWDSDELPNEKVKSKKSSKSSGNKKGGQKGNKNAVGNDGGAPLGSQNALKHGGYSAVYWDTLDEDEKSIIEDMPQDEETLLIDQIKLYTVRERRILLAIQKVQNAKGDQVLDSVSSQETKRRFRDTTQKEQYNQMIEEKIASGERLPGDAYTIYTNTDNKQNVISRLEDELTRVQRAKNQAIDSLAKLNIEKQKIEMLRDKDDVEVEDTDETDEAIYDKEISQEKNDTV